MEVKKQIGCQSNFSCTLGPSIVAFGCHNVQNNRVGIKLKFCDSDYNLYYIFQVDFHLHSHMGYRLAYRGLHLNIQFNKTFAGHLFKAG